MNTMEAARREAGISQIDMAKRLGISQSSYSRLESGKIRLQPKTAKAIGKEVNRNWTEFYEDPEPEEAES